MTSCSQYPTDSNKPRCSWCLGHPLYIDYHDNEWGVASYNDRHLFEMLCLEGAQAGLNWLTILKKRDGYRKAFSNFDIESVALFSDNDFQRLLCDPSIVRNRLKIASCISNAQKIIKIIETDSSFSDYVWKFTDKMAVINRWNSLAELPCSNHISDAMSKELKKLGFKFVGTTICYSFMQAIGMVNDHVKGCYKSVEL